jgi:hypothetical protein
MLPTSGTCVKASRCPSTIVCGASPPGYRLGGLKRLSLILYSYFSDMATHIVSPFWGLLWRRVLQIVSETTDKNERVGRAGFVFGVACWERSQAYLFP